MKPTQTIEVHWPEGDVPEYAKIEFRADINRWWISIWDLETKTKKADYSNLDLEDTYEYLQDALDEVLNLWIVDGSETTWAPKGTKTLVSMPEHPDPNYELENLWVPKT